MSDSTAANSLVVTEVRVKLHTLIGEMLAQGFTSEEILLSLETTQQMTAEDAIAALRGVYDSWSSVNEGLNLQVEDSRNWHQFLRLKLLQKALEEATTPSRRLALQILDSLASIQGLETAPTQLVPCMIELVAKVEDE